MATKTIRLSGKKKKKKTQEKQRKEEITEGKKRNAVVPKMGLEPIRYF